MNKEFSYFLIALLLLLLLNFLYNRETLLTSDSTLFTVNPRTSQIEVQNASDVYSYVDNTFAENPGSGFTLSDLNNKILENNTTIQSKIDTDIKVPEDMYLLKTTFNTFKNSGGYLHTNFMKKSNPYSATVDEINGEYTFRDGTVETEAERLAREEEEAAAAYAAETQAMAYNAIAGAATGVALKLFNFKKYLQASNEYMYPFGKFIGTTYIPPRPAPDDSELGDEWGKLSTARQNEFSDEVTWSATSEDTNTRRKNLYIWYLYTANKIANPGRTYENFYITNERIEHLLTNWGAAEKNKYRTDKNKQIIKSKINNDYGFGESSVENSAQTRFNNLKAFKNLQITAEWDVVGMVRPQSRGGPAVSDAEVYDQFSTYMTIDDQKQYDSPRTDAVVTVESKTKKRYMVDTFIQARRGEYRGNNYSDFRGIDYQELFNEYVSPDGAFYNMRQSNNRTAEQYWTNASVGFKRKYEDGRERADPWLYWSKKSLMQILKFEYSDKWLNKLGTSGARAKEDIYTSTDDAYTQLETNKEYKEYLAVNRIRELDHGNYIEEREKHKNEINNWVYDLIETKTIARYQRHYRSYRHHRAQYRHNGLSTDTESDDQFKKARAQRINREKDAVDNIMAQPWWIETQSVSFLNSANMEYSRSAPARVTGDIDYDYRQKTDREKTYFNNLWNWVWYSYFNTCAPYDGAGYANGRRESSLALYLSKDFETKQKLGNITNSNKHTLWSRSDSWLVDLKAAGIVPERRTMLAQACPGYLPPLELAASRPPNWRPPGEGGRG